MENAQKGQMQSFLDATVQLVPYLQFVRRIQKVEEFAIQIPARIKESALQVAVPMIAFARRVLLVPIVRVGEPSIHSQFL